VETQELHGKIVQSGFVVMETYDVELQIPPELEEKFKRNPEELIAQFLRQQGQEVNSVQVVRDSTETAISPRRARRDHYFHIVYPDNERSGWICA
jgi:hypothetical protein